MANKVVALNQEDVSVRIRVLNNTDGTPNTGITSSTTGFDLWYQRGENSAAVSGGVSTGDLGSVTASHTDWNFIHIEDGWYRCDFPDSAFQEGVGSVLCGLKTDAHTGVSVTVDIEPLYKYQGTPSAVTSTTTTFPSGTTPLKGDIIMVVDGTGEPGNQVMVTSATGEVATHPAFETGISATTTTVLLIAGDATTADGGVNNDVPNSDAATPTEVNAQCDTAISDANLATLAKMLAYFQLALRKDAGIATDKADELAEINTDEGSGAGTFDNTQPTQANIVEVLGTDIEEGTADNNRQIGY